MENTKRVDVKKIGNEIAKILNKPPRHSKKSIKHWEEESVKSGNMRCYLNPEWKDRWLPFIKYDWDWDFAFIETLIAKKLKLMKEFYLHDLKKGIDKRYTTNIRSRNKKIVRQIDKVLELYEEYNSTTSAWEEEKKLRIKFYHKLALLSGNWWD